MIGIPEYVELSNQVIFDHVVDHFKKQQVAAKEDEGCRYRTVDGLSCAVGCLLTDKEYDDDMEWNSVDGLIEAELLPERFLPFKALLESLQSVHDTFLDAMTYSILNPRTSEQLKIIAQRYKLSDVKVDW